MDSFVFIHGSSDGQSVFIPSNADSAICNEVADKYFRGREPRRKESSAQIAMFVDLYKNPKGTIYSLYSLVNNDCSGANGREGQYFAVTVVCKELFVFPEAVYRMLSAAYMQMLKTNKIISCNEKGEKKYVISQFQEEQVYLLAFSKKIEEAFLQVSNGLVKALSKDVFIADYDSWQGVRVNIEMCNSMATYRSLCTNGRVYISEEYESLSQRVKTLETQIKNLKSLNLELEQRTAEAKRSEKSKVQNEIEELNLQIKEKDANIEKLSVENTRYKTTIELVRKELSKYEKIGKSIHNVQGHNSRYQAKNKKDILKICLLFIILFITLISGLMNYAFFRGNSLPFEGKKEQTEKINNHSVKASIDEKETIKTPTSLVVSPKAIEFEAIGGKQTVNILTDGDWETPISPNDWVTIRKVDNKQLSIEVMSHDLKDIRECTFMIRTNTGNFEEQIKIFQKGKQASKKNANGNPNYGIVVKNSLGKTIQSGTLVRNGDVLNVTVTNPSKAANGFGWKYWNCSGDRRNVKDVNVTVDAKEGDDIIISYGDISSNGYRERFSLKLQSTEDLNAENNNGNDSDPNNSRNATDENPE